MLKLKVQSFGHLMWRANSLEKTLMVGKIEGRRRRGQQRMRWMASLALWTWIWESFGSWWWTGKRGVLQFMGSQRVGPDWATELNWLALDRQVGKEFTFSRKACTQVCRESLWPFPQNKLLVSVIVEKKKWYLIFFKIFLSNSLFLPHAHPPFHWYPVSSIP